MRFIKSELYFPVVIGIHAVLWAIDLNQHQGDIALAEGELPAQRVIGEFMSSWVITVFAFNLLMVTRLRFVERIFGGLDKMFLIHRRSGMVAITLLLLHVAIVPKLDEFTLGKPLGVLALVGILLGVVFAAAPAIKRRLPYHKWVVGHRMMGVFYVLGIAHSFFVPALITQLPLVRTYVYGMASVGVTAWLYKAFLFKRLHAPAEYVVTSVRRFGRSAVDVQMRPDGEALKHEAGQFAFFSFERHAPNESHPFTIASAPDEEELRLVVKASGDFTNDFVANIQEGDKVAVEGPYGHLTQRMFRNDEQLWVAGGIGITPFLSLAHSLPSSDRRATLYWTVRSDEEAYFADELQTLADASTEFDFVLWRSNEQGYLSADNISTDAVSNQDIVICGPAPLRDGMYKQLKSNGIRAANIHSEEFAFR